MKFVVIAALTAFHLSPASAEEQPFPHEYLNDGHFSAQSEPVETAQVEEPYPHVYENGGHFEGAAPESGNNAN